ncbi:hypothetical protein [Roseovarius rhodophyticola]|uniref:Uncharacterized protein n=1 Tax=Roseovarius rhodophyticola TaxID=3080827 RepID=A0ABZ2TFF4_9RHOB|nr:hypothetical protein [Roseovarius sp. W115]MDV2930895.1 hypothetical protein [Roseovarius sp. W115]
MTADGFTSFDERLRKIDRKKARMAGGYSARVTREGLIVFRPKRRRTGFSVRGLAFLVVGFFLFKGMIMAHLGTTVYDQRVDALNQGTIMEQAGAFAMQSDPITLEIAKQLHVLFN